MCTQDSEGRKESKIRFANLKKSPKMSLPCSRFIDLEEVTPYARTD